MAEKILVGDFGDEFDISNPALDSVRKDSSRAGCTEIVKYDGNGDIVVDVVKKSKSQNGSGFVISYTAKMCEFLETTRQGSTVRLFLYLAHNQQYGTDGKTFGYRCSHKYLQQVLNLDRKSVYNALSYLKEKFLVVETTEEGTSEFMVNPNYVTIGSSKKERMRIWNSRWATILAAKGSKDLKGLNAGVSR